jgi:hypothetical protein
MGPVHKYPNFSTRSFKTDPPKTRACGNWKQSNREINLCIGIDQRKIEVNSQILEKKMAEKLAPEKRHSFIHNGLLLLFDFGVSAIENCVWGFLNFCEAILLQGSVEAH